MARISISFSLLFIVIIVSLVGMSESASQTHKSISDLYHDPQTVLSNLDLVVKAALSPNENLAYTRLEHMCNTYGPRLCGSQALEMVLDWAAGTMESEDQLDNAQKEAVPVPHWIRNHESVDMVAPWKRKLPMLGLGGSVGSDGIIEAEIVAVQSFDELKERSAEVPGKIVVYNAPFESYGKQVIYRRRGAQEAAKYGAVGALVRSVTGFSMQTPHTGVMDAYDEKKIPVACITVEDAEMLYQLNTNSSSGVILQMVMNAVHHPEVTSYNVMGEVSGSDNDNSDSTIEKNVIVLGGHIDSWDVGTGAMDDGGGVMVTWEAVRLIRKLGLQPKHTVRAVLFVNEEWGGSGGRVYASTNNRTETTQIALESDMGVFDPLGVGFSGSDEAMSIMQMLNSQVVKATGFDLKVTVGGGGVDIGPLGQGGVPTSSLNTDISTYFNYHHSDADVMTVMDAEEMRKCTAVVAGMAYLISELDEPLPRKD